MNIKDLGLLPGDLISFDFKSPDGEKWAWAGNFLYEIPGGQSISLEQVVSIYGAPKADEDGWFTKTARRSSENPKIRGDVWDHRDKDFLTILRRYEKWRCMEVSRFIFQKANGSVVMLPEKWSPRGKLSIYLWEKYHEEWLPLVS